MRAVYLSLAFAVLTVPPQSTLPTGKEPPQSTLESSGRKYPRPPEVKRTQGTAKVAVKTPVDLPYGYHEHECPFCKTRWGHGAVSAGKVHDHTCPSCNRVLPYPWYPVR